MPQRRYGEIRLPTRKKPDLFAGRNIIGGVQEVGHTSIWQVQAQSVTPWCDLTVLAVITISQKTRCRVTLLAYPRRSLVQRVKREL